MENALVIRLAFRNLFRNTRRSVLTLVLIGFSLAALIVTDGMTIGMSKLMSESVTHTLAGEAQVNHRGFAESFDSDLVIEDSSHFEALLASNEGVSGYAPRVMVGGMVSSSYNVAGGMIYGVDAAREIGVSKLKSSVREGQYLSGEGTEILIGHTMAELLEIGLGDRVVLTVSEVGSGDLAQALFRVSGVFDFGMREIDENIVFINIGKARETLGLNDQSHQIVMQFHNEEDANNRQLPLLDSLTKGDVVAVNWMDANPQIASVLQMTGYSSLIIGSILFLLTSLGVINSMFMSIYERIYEIGVVKAIGTRPSGLIGLVMTEAALLAMMGCVFGIVLGAALNVWFSIHGIPMGEVEVSGVSFDSTIKTVLAIHQFTLFPLFVIGLTLLAAVYPARFASRIAPATALQRSL